MKKLGIVILNYKSCNDTIDCVNSILEQDYLNIEVIIVDNNSGDNSCKVFKKLYDKSKNIHLIESETNLGFAKGNNLGIKYARNELNCDFVFILNSDTIFTKNNICSFLVNSYKYNVGIINPACCNIDGSFQNPYGKFNENLYIIMIKHLIFIIWSFIRNIFNLNVSISNHLKKEDESDMKKYKYIVQGPAYILTPEFFKYYNGLFPKTFLYEEELILAWYMKKANLKTIFVESPYIIHKEAGASKSLSRSNRKLRFQLESLLRAIPMTFKSKEGIKQCYSD